MAASQPPLPPQLFDPATVFIEVYKCAKKNKNWNKVLSSLMIHPEWLTKIPDGLKIKILNESLIFEVYILLHQPLM